MNISKRTFQLFIEGDENATGLVFEEYKNLLYFIIASYISNKDDCDDVLSETFLKAIEHRKEIKDLSSIKTFLTTIAKNEALQFKRKNKPVVLDNLDEEYGKSDSDNVVFNVFGNILNHKETIIVYYRAIFSYSWKEIYQETGTPISTSKLIYKKAKEKLKKEYL